METMEMKQTNQHGHRRKKKNWQGRANIWTILAIVFFLIALICVGILAARRIQTNSAQKKMDELAKQTNLSMNSNTPSSVLEQIAEKIEAGQQDDLSESGQVAEEEKVYVDPMQKLADLGVPVPEGKEIDFSKLTAEVNGDIYSWIYIPGTNIDYPVLRHPADNSYYLNHNLDGSKGYPGCIYTENYNSTDWLDPVTVVYGHDMRATGTMFHGLHKFEKQDFFDQNQYIYIYTPDRLFVYQIFSACVHTDEHLLYGHDFYDKIEMADFFAHIYDEKLGKGFVRDGIEITGEDKVIVLSTCIKNRPSNRFLVCGVLLNE